MAKTKAVGLFRVRKSGQAGIGAKSYELNVVEGTFPTGDLLTTEKNKVEKFEGDFWVKVVDGKVTKAGKTKKDL